jgi:predicted RNA-binding Zn-ribbon protein involved in translation (DUF1610 family)
MDVTSAVGLEALVVQKPASNSSQESAYETSCGLCGQQIHFRRPLTDWTKVYCPGCGDYVAVR